MARAEPGGANRAFGFATCAEVDAEGAGLALEGRSAVRALAAATAPGTVVGVGWALEGWNPAAGCNAKEPAWEIGAAKGGSAGTRDDRNPI